MSQIDLQWFAAEDEGRTEKPSDYKIRKAREEGRVAKSQELNGTIVFLFSVVLLIFLAPWMEEKFEELMIYYFKHVTDSNMLKKEFGIQFLKYFAMLVLPFSIVGLIAGVASNIIQNKGFLFTTKTIQPKFDKIVPKFGQYFKRTLFSFEGVFNIIKSILKIIILGLISFLLIRGDIPKVIATQRVGGPRPAMSLVGGMVAKMLVVAAVVLLIIGIVDYFVQRRTFMESLKMTKQEVKQEFKEMEGDPEVKSHLEQAQRELLNSNMPKAVRESDVVIANPEHFAVALQWKQETNDAPQVTAKGEDMTAQTIKRIAREADVPIVENRPLARSLYTDTEVGDIIPSEYLRAIATVYAQIGYMEKMKK